MRAYIFRKVADKAYTLWKGRKERVEAERILNIKKKLVEIPKKYKFFYLEKVLIRSKQVQESCWHKNQKHQWKQENLMKVKWTQSH